MVLWNLSLPPGLIMAALFHGVPMWKCQSIKKCGIVRISAWSTHDIYAFNPHLGQQFRYPTVDSTSQLCGLCRVVAVSSCGHVELCRVHWRLCRIVSCPVVVMASYSVSSCGVMNCAVSNYGMSAFVVSSYGVSSFAGSSCEVSSCRVSKCVVSNCGVSSCCVSNCSIWRVELCRIELCICRIGPCRVVCIELWLCRVVSCRNEGLPLFVKD